MSAPLVALLCLSAFIAEVIGTMAGFGAATILTPVASWFLPIKTAVAIVACFHAMGTTSRTMLFRRSIDWPIVWKFGVTGVALSFLGAHTAARLSPSMIRASLGAFLLVYVGLEVTRVFKVRLPATSWTLGLGGMASGFIAGLIGTGGAIRSVCLLAFGLPTQRYLATSAVIACMVDTTRLPVYVWHQQLPWTLWPVIVSLSVVAFSGAWVGRRMVQRVSGERVKHIVLVMLALMGVKLVFDGLQGAG